MSGYRVLDIETVPDLRYWTKGPVKWRQEPVMTYTNLHQQVSSDGVSWVTEQLDLRCQTNECGHRYHRRVQSVDTWNGLAPILVPEEPFPPPQAHRVVAMAWVNLSGDDGRYYAYESSQVWCRWSTILRPSFSDLDGDVIERALLERFGEEQSRDEATLVTWNGRTFDLPVINLRSFLHGIPCEWYYKERDTRYRYTEAAHCDLMDFFSDYGAARSMKLGDVARLAGLPGKFGEVTGDGVAEIVAGSVGTDATEVMRKVGEYCLADALQTAFLFVKSRVHKGMISTDFFNTVVAPSFQTPLQAIVERARQK